MRRREWNRLFALSVLLSGLTGLYGQHLEIVGHRGAAYTAPENTMASVRQAVALGADAVEVDIHKSKDGKLVVIHDGNTQRTTGVDRVVAESTYADLSLLDAGSFKSEKFAGEPIPLLDDVLAYLPEGVNLYIEIKGPVSIVPILQEMLEGYPLREQIRIIAFDLETITEAKKVLDDIPCYYLKTIIPGFRYNRFVRELKSRNLDGADLYYRTITKRLVRKLNEEGMPCLAWTVNSVEQAEKLKAMGVDGITTDRPGLLKNQL